MALWRKNWDPIELGIYGVVVGLAVSAVSLVNELWSGSFAEGDPFLRAIVRFAVFVGGGALAFAAAASILNQFARQSAVLGQRHASAHANSSASAYGNPH